MDFNDIFLQVVQNSLALLREESDEDYKPCDPSVIVERVQGLESAYEELVRVLSRIKSGFEAFNSFISIFKD